MSRRSVSKMTDLRKILSENKLKVLKYSAPIAESNQVLTRLCPVAIIVLWTPPRASGQDDRWHPYVIRMFMLQNVAVIAQINQLERFLTAGGPYLDDLGYSEP